MLPSPHSRMMRVLAPMALFAGLLFTLMWVPLGRGADGRDFAGFYEVTNPLDLGNGTFQVTLAVRIFNYSDADVANATVILQDSGPSTQDYGYYPGSVSIADRESLKVSGDFNISADEYNRWQDSSMPSLRIEYQDINGNSVRRTIEVTPSVAVD